MCGLLRLLFALSHFQLLLSILIHPCLLLSNFPVTLPNLSPFLFLVIFAIDSTGGQRRRRMEGGRIFSRGIVLSWYGGCLWACKVRVRIGQSDLLCRLYECVVCVTYSLIYRVG